MASSHLSLEAPVVIAVDLLPHSHTALHHGLALARARQLPVVVLHVVHESPETAGFYRAHCRDCFTRPLVDIAKTLLKGWLQRELDDPAAVSTRLVEGVPGNRIAEVAEQLNAACIVLVSHGRKGLARYWHGSVVEAVKRRTRRELLILEPGAGDPVPATGRSETRSQRVQA